MAVFSTGDRVQVTDQHPHDYARGLTGMIANAPSAFGDLLEGQCWVEFDSPIPSSNDCVSLAGAFWPEHLRHLS